MTDVPGELSFSNIVESMRAFAFAGLGPAEKRLASITGASRQFLNAVGPSEERIGAELNDGALRAQQNRYFLPLPPPVKDSPKGFFLAFFRPRFFAGGEDAWECDIDLLIVSGHQTRRTFGIRFERGRSDNDTHAYSHMQLTKKFEGHDPATDLPDDIPNSYPAFPTRCRAAGDTWLALLVSLYGLSSAQQLALSKVASAIEQQQKRPLISMIMPRVRHVFDVAAND